MKWVLMRQLIFRPHYNITLPVRRTSGLRSAPPFPHFIEALINFSALIMRFVIIAAELATELLLLNCFFLP